MAWSALLKKTFTTLTKPEQMLGQRVFRSGVWILSLRILIRLFGFARTIVLAWLLAPSDFGLFGVAVLSMSILDTFSQTGMQAALVQKKGEIHSYLDTAWTIQVLRGLGIAVCLIIFSPWIAAYFRQPMAVDILRVLALTKVFQGLTNIGVIYFQKNLEFHKQFFYQLVGLLVDLTVSLTAAFLLRSVWALVFGLLAGDFVRMIVSFRISPYSPKIRLDLQKFKELSRFGRWIFGTTILLFLVFQGDSLFIGRYLGATALGLYQMANQISSAYADDLGKIVYELMLPTYAILQEDIKELRSIYLKVLQVSLYAAALLSDMIFILAPAFTSLFLGAKWMPMVPAMQVLALAGFLRVMDGSSSSMLQGIGKPHLTTGINLVRLFILILSIYPLTSRYGILGTAISIFLSLLVSIMVSNLLIVKFMHCPLKDLLKVIFAPILAGLVMVLMVVGVQYWAPLQGFLQFFLAAFVGIAGYLIIVVVFDRVFGFQVIPTVRRLIHP